MAQETLFEQFARSKFTQRHIDELRLAHEDGYQTACDHHEPSRGGNETTFGFSLHVYINFEIERVGAREPSLWTIRSRHPEFRYTIGGIELGSYRAGKTADQDIWTSFPGNDGSARKLLPVNLEIPGTQLQVHEIDRGVIAHLGNPTGGLEALYFAVPGRVEGDQIRQWAYAYELWKRPGIATPSGGTSQTPPTAQIVRPRVSLKTKRPASAN